MPKAWRITNLVFACEDTKRSMASSAYLPAFLRVIRQRQYDFALYNCFHLLNDWIICSTGHDPMATYRDRCQTEADAISLLRAGGGTAAIAMAALSELGAHATEAPSAGDVALVLAPIEHDGSIKWRETCAICVDEKHFALLTSDLGLLICPMKMIRAWSLAQIKVIDRHAGDHWFALNRRL